MNNEENLIPFSERSKDEAREMGRQGGVKSGESRRRKKSMKQAAQLLLSLDANVKGQGFMQAMGIPEEDMNNQMFMLAVAFRQAVNGDVKAMNFIRDAAGVGATNELKQKELKLKQDELKLKKQQTETSIPEDEARDDALSAALREMAAEMESDKPDDLT